MLLSKSNNLFRREICGHVEMSHDQCNAVSYKRLTLYISITEYHLLHMDR